MKQFFFTSVEFISPLFAYKTFRKHCDFLFFSGTKRGRYSFLPFNSFEKKEIYSDEKKSFETLQKKYKNLKKNYDLSSLGDWNIPYSGGLNIVFSYDYTQEFEKNIWKSSDEKKNYSLLFFFRSFFSF